jgi:hypothetical protein
VRQYHQTGDRDYCSAYTFATSERLLTRWHVLRANSFAMAVTTCW